MTLPSQNHQSFIVQVSPTPYASGQLTDVLLDLQHSWASGVARIEVLSEVGISQYFLIFCDGAIVYAGRSIPTPYEFVTELSLHSRIDALAKVQQFAARRSSIQGLLQAMVETGILQWREVAKAMRGQVQKVLEELLPTAGQVSFESSTWVLDLRYGQGEEGLLIDALLLERELRCQE